MLSAILLATMGVDWSDSIVARVGDLERRADSLELRVDAMERSLALAEASGCTCKPFCKCDKCTCGLTEAPIPAPPLPRLYVATTYDCPHCDALKAYLDSHGILYDTVADNVGTVPRFVANGQAVVGNRPADVAALIGIPTAETMEPMGDACESCESYPAGDIVGPRRRFQPVRGIGRFLFRR